MEKSAFRSYLQETQLCSIGLDKAVMRTENKHKCTCWEQELPECGQKYVKFKGQKQLTEDQTQDKCKQP